MSPRASKIWRAVWAVFMGLVWMFNGWQLHKLYLVWTAPTAIVVPGEPVIIPHAPNGCPVPQTPNFTPPRHQSVDT